MKRISWKRGMRLTDDLLRASDDCTFEIFRKLGLISSSGLFGLIQSELPFEISLNFGKGYLEIDSLCCRALTRNGTLIDVCFDTRYNANYPTRVMIPDLPGVEEYLLVIEESRNQWKPVQGDLEEPVYIFSLISTDTIMPEGGIPIARIIDDYGWRIDEMDFVPPCMFVSNHHKFKEQLIKFTELLTIMENKTRQAIGNTTHQAVAVFWPILQQIRIEIDKNKDFLSPMELLAKIQQCVSAFACACELNPNLKFPELKMYRSFELAPYTFKDAFVRIRIGIEICASIVDKLGAWAHQPVQTNVQNPVQVSPSKEIPTPVIDSKYSQILCNSSETTIPVIYQNSSVSIHFTIDGTVPTKNSSKATKTNNGYKVKFDNGFRQENRQETERTLTLNLIAFDGTASSRISSYSISLKKDVKFRNAIPI